MEIENFQHYLSFQKTLGFFLDKIKQGNSLSKTIFRNVNFNEGIFFTLLPLNADLSKIYDFSNGGIIPQNEDKVFLNSGVFIPLTSMQESLANFSFKFLNQKNNNSIILEEVVWEKQSKNIHIPTVDLAFKNSEVYYLLSKKNSFDSVIKTIDNADALWFFFAAFLENLPNDLPQQLIDKNLEEISENIKYLVTTAYDGESYIIWERKEDSSIKSNLAFQ